MRFYKDGAFIEDQFTHLDDEAEDTVSGPVFISLTRFLAEPSKWAGRANGLGVRVEAGEAIEPLIPHLRLINAIALSFPKYTDGRNYSTARLLRERHGYEGELRAIGNVLIDQVHFMLRCGINALEITNPHTAKALEAGDDKGMKLHYQPASIKEPQPQGQPRPWLRGALR